MQDVLENRGNTIPVSQQSGLMSTVFREYRNHFGLFWRVMLPLLVVSLLFIIALILFFKFGSPEAQWIFSTSDGSSRTIASTFDLSSGTSQPSSRSVGVHWKISFTALSLYPKLGFLWLAICPLAFVIAQYRGGVNVTSRASWQQTLRRTATILGVWIVFGLLGLGVFGVDMLLIAVLPGSPPLLTPLLSMILVAYFVVKWSLYHQGIIIENLSAIAALRRSGELVRGAWGRFIGIYLLFAWASAVITTALLNLTVLLLSFAIPEFEMVREALLSAAFLTLLWGSFPEVVLESIPSFWVLAALGIATTLIHAILTPIWALLTTHLYMERAGTQLKETAELENVPQAVSG